jgi:UDP-N-acetylglucosamine 2-epimerase (non-hydrolysing)
MGPVGARPLSRGRAAPGIRRSAKRSETRLARAVFKALERLKSLIEAQEPRHEASGQPRRESDTHIGGILAAMARCTVLSVVGTRPNFMKTLPVVAALKRRPADFEHVLVHTGQHYDHTMSGIFLEELGVGDPDYRLEVGPGTHAQQTARVMESLEPVLLEVQPDVTLVPGDVNSTLAAALVASKLRVPIGHIEAGLRSFDRSMPEEVNRVLIDQVADLLFTHSPEAIGHLRAEGISPTRIHPVGNTMIDTLVAMKRHIDARLMPEALGLTRGTYLVVTLHRPALVDGPGLADAMAALHRISVDWPVVFPVHPRTQAALEAPGIAATATRVKLLEPLGYLDFLSLVSGAAAVLTDSGGIQEETTFLGIPCFTLRDTTERPVTVLFGTNRLLGLVPQRIREIPALLDDARRGPSNVPAGWDGHAAERIAEVLAESPLASTASKPFGETWVPRPAPVSDEFSPAPKTPHP